MTVTLILKFHKELNDFLPSRKRNRFYKVFAGSHQSMKDIIEAESVPHAEVDVILRNKKPAFFTSHPLPGDRVEIFPRHTLVSDIKTHLQPAELKHPKFLVDENLGKLVKRMRMIGINTAYFKGGSDKELVTQALHERRIILTRDVGILKRASVKRGYWLRNDNPDRQLTEILKRYQLVKHVRPFHRCMVCNGIIKKTGRKIAAREVPPRTLHYFLEFFRCSSCGKIYWKGSHYENMTEKILRLIN